MEKNYVVRRAETADLDMIKSLWIGLAEDQLQKDEYFNGTKEYLSGVSQFDFILKNERCAIFVLECRGIVSGFIEIWVHEKDFYFSIDSYAYVLHFFIEKSLRDDRTVSMNKMVFDLYKASESWAKEKGVKYIQADVFSHNQRVFKLLNYIGMKPYRQRLVKKFESDAI